MCGVSPPRLDPITTNKAIRNWTEFLAGDEALSAGMLDRLLHKAHVYTRQPSPCLRPYRVRPGVA
jgi:DNA replication protein DnaC